jgi:hypothetical protein
MSTRPTRAPFERGLDAAAAVVADHHDVLDLEHIDGELDHRQAVEVGMHHHVGDIAMDEDLARQQADDLVGRHARIGAADPQQLRRLQVRELFEIARIDFAHLVRPGAIEVEQVVQRAVVERVLGPVFEVEGEELRALDRRLVIGGRLVEAQFAVELDRDAHRRQRVEQDLAVADPARGADRRQRQVAADAEAAERGIDIEALEFADALGQRPDADAAGALAIDRGVEQAPFGAE